MELSALQADDQMEIKRELEATDIGSFEYETSDCLSPFQQRDSRLNETEIFTFESEAGKTGGFYFNK